jgi:zinc protease
MKKKLISIALTLISVSAFATNTANTISISNKNLFNSNSIIENKLINTQDKKIGNFSSYYLDNGMKVILLPFPNHNKTGVYFTARVGGKNEGYGETGMAHLLEHMLFKSTSNIKDIKKELTDIGAQWNGFTSHDQTTYFEIFNDNKNNDKLNKVLKLEAERFFEATFTKEDLSKEMTVVRNELERNASSPQQKLWEETLNKTFDWYGYKHAVIGEKSDIEHAPFYKLKEFYEKYYQPKNTVLLVYGAFNEESIKEEIKKNFKKYTNKDNHIVNNWTQEPFSLKNSSTTIFSQDEVLATNVTWKAPNFVNDTRTVAAGILFTSASQQPYGSLYKKYILDKKEQNKFLINLATFNAPVNDYSPLFVQIQQSVKDNKSANQNIDAIVKDIESGNIFNKENFENLKKSLLNDYNKLEADPDSIAKNILQHEGAGDWTLFFHEKELIKKAKYEDGVQLLKEFLTPYNRNIVTIQKDPKLKESIFYDVANKLNSTNHRNDFVDNINNIQSHEFNFDYKYTNVFEPNLENLKDKTVSFDFKHQNKNLTVSLIKKETAGDFIYFSLSNLYNNEELQSKYRNSCQMLEAIPSFGGKNYNKEKLDKIMQELEADYSLSFSELSVKVPKKNFSHSLHILFNVLMNPSFEEKEFLRTKEQMIAALESLESNQDALNKEKIVSLMNPYDIKHPLYSFSTKESLDLIKNSNIESLKNCYNVFKGVVNSYASVVGDINKDEIEASLKSYLNWESSHNWGRIKDDKIKDYDIILKENNGKSVFILNDFKKPNSLNLKVAFFPMDINEPDYFKVKIALHIFGEGSNSRLFKELREANGLSYTAQSGFQANYFSKKASIKTYVISSVDNADKANMLIDETWNKFIKNGITEEELKSTKEHYKNTRVLSLSEDSQLVDVNNFLKKNEKNIDWLIEHDKEIASTNVVEINAAIKKYLENIKFITVYNK